MNDFWIPISYDDDTQARLASGIYSCYLVHCFTVQTLNDYFLDHLESYPLVNFRRELAIFLRESKENLSAQHYSMTKAAEKTFPYFTENKKIIDGKFVAVAPIRARYYQQIQIEPRQIWRKYLALNSLITTVYGTIYLEESWPDILAAQAAEKKIEFGAAPFLWHSILVHADPQQPRLRFNLHEPDSKFSRRRQQEMTHHV